MLNLAINKRRSSNGLSFTDKVVSIFILFKLQTKTLFSTPVMVFMIFFLPSILLFGIGTIFPQSVIFVSGFGLPILLNVGIIFGYLYYSSSKTTLNKNYKLTKVNPNVMNISIFWTILFFSFLSISFEFIVMIVFTSLGWVFSVNWAFLSPESPSRDALIINWSKLPWFEILYFWLMTIVLSFSMFAMFRQVFDSNQTFSMFVFSFLLYTLFFGHVSVGIFVRPQDNGQLWSRTFAEDGLPSVKYNKWSDFASLLSPQNFLNQTFFSMFYSGASPMDPSYNPGGGEYYNILDAHYNYFQWSDDPSYNYALIMPYVYLVAMGSIAYGVVKD